MYTENCSVSIRATADTFKLSHKQCVDILVEVFVIKHAA